MVQVARRKALSLIELLVVLSIVAILCALMAAAVQRVARRGGPVGLCE